MEGYQIHDIKKGENSENEGKREIYLSSMVINDLKKLHDQRSKERELCDHLWRDGEHNLLLALSDGTPYNPPSIITWWKRFLKRHKLRYITPYSLRHTSATLLINQGVHP